MCARERIESMSEAEAKDTLLRLVEILANWSPCGDDCCVPCWDLCHEHKDVTCEEIWLLLAREQEG